MPGMISRTRLHAGRVRTAALKALTVSCERIAAVRALTVSCERAAAVRVLTVSCSVFLLVACQSLYGPPVPAPSPQPRSGTPEPQPGTPEPQPPVPAPVPPAPPPQPAKEFRLGPASAALVKQSRAQSVKGEYPAAVATLERALRIEPDNPLVWLELGQVHLASRNPPQAESMARKAIALATGNPGVQATGWRLVGDALRARGRDLDATEAYQRAALASPR
jgi:tetratricopeptide (TPR) repeat protein